ncbi:transposase (plasmid) [Streptomyces sp. NBC_01166]|uniref:RNA-guided endonuclease InsQ/TnpB family protein n=1 Tax=Streptomyces sp. NBC_01166 TaxID=2903755 RepID=UPI00386CE0B3|nr:transposase [Streptomyces sp. NBC_01166]
MRTEVLKAFRFALDPTPAQEQQLLRWAGNARLAFNYALAAKRRSHEEWRAEVAALVEAGEPEAEARKRVRVPIPSKPSVYKAFVAERGDTRAGLEGVCPWWHEVNTYVFQSGFLDADTAWKNWLTSFKGTRAGRRVGYPRFKKRGRARDSFRLHHNVNKPGIRLATYRRLRLPTFGEVRLHESAKRLQRLIGKGEAVVQSVTVSRGGHRWYASVLCKVAVSVPDQPSKAQRARGTVGVDLGVKVLAGLSRPLIDDEPASMLVPNSRPLRTAGRRLAKAQKALSRTKKGSARRDKARRRVGRLHHEVALRRNSALHLLTKQLTSRFATVAIEDLHVSGMTRSARGTQERPGKNVRQKTGLNRAILDSAPGELRRQLTYKASWYGSQLAVLDRWWPSSKTCSACGWQNPRQTLADRVFTCDTCGLSMDRDLNAARNIERHAVAPSAPHVAPGTGETKNARGVSVRLPAPRGRKQETVKREDTSPPGMVPPRQSNLPTSPNPRQEQAKLF